MRWKRMKRKEYVNMPEFKPYTCSCGYKVEKPEEDAGGTCIGCRNRYEEEQRGHEAEEEITARAEEEEKEREREQEEEQRAYEEGEQR